MKNILSLVVAVVIAVNVFGFGFLSVQASAVAPIVIGILELAKYTAIGFLGGEAAHALVQAAGIDSDFNAEYFLQQTTESLTNDNLIYAELNDNNFTVFHVSDDCPSESREFAKILVGELNNLPDTARFVDPYIGASPFTSQNYELVKTKVVNAFNEYLEAKRQKVAITDYENTLAALSSALGHEWTPTYNFAFEGPISQVQFEAMSQPIDLTLNGWTFLAPKSIPHFDLNGYFTSEAQAYSFFCNRIEKVGTDLYRGYRDYDSKYSTCAYILYNNDLFIFSYSQYTECLMTLTFLQYGNNFQYFRNSEGVSITDYLTYPAYGASFGLLYYPNANVNFSFPDNMEEITDDTFTTTTDGSSVSVPLSDDEAAIAAAIATGVLPANFDLTLNPDGTIAAADGITIEQLQNIAQQIMDNQVQFEDFEEYLQYISALLRTANVNTNTINSVLNGLRAYEQQQTDYLDRINANTAALTAALTQAQAQELDLPDIDADGFIVTHSGLAEATTIADSIPVVSQVSQLLNNLLDASQYDSSPPNFRFYWDSDGDGTQELYNALDLSFLDTELSNNNLQDGERFQSSMTIRQFLQYLIIFICYVAFAIRIIKKLPSLFGSSESSNEFNSTIK